IPSSSHRERRTRGSDRAGVPSRLRGAPKAQRSRRQADRVLHSRLRRACRFPWRFPFSWSDSTPQFGRRLGAARSDDLSAYRNFSTDAPRVASPSFYVLVGRFLDGNRIAPRALRVKLSSEKSSKRHEAVHSTACLYPKSDGSHGYRRRPVTSTNATAPAREKCSRFDALTR